MAVRSSVLLRFILTGIILFLGWYTLKLYADLFGRLSTKNVKIKDPESKSAVISSDNRISDDDLEDPDDLIDKNKIALADKEWDKQQGLFQPNVKKVSKNPCSVSTACGSDEFSFKIITGAANVIGPSICFNGSIIMKNSLNNVDRGMNIALINGRTGESLKQHVFDLYSKDSTEVKQFLKDLKEEEIILVSTSDDAAFKLDDEAKQTFANIGSAHAKELGFRDNWVFVGGASMKKPSGFEQIIKNDKEKNKYGDWPEAITLEGCLPKIR
ncbi:unnamed protein product [Clavelina lepadiformis]|uniref:ILEI/PANDER domain-containing protein n=1 Tax=Clavelina lepadiformis TaxID=159417 RepID=A0ABP0G0U5_CLALP